MVNPCSGNRCQPYSNSCIQIPPLIVCGFAYKKTNEGISVFDLNNGKGAAVFADDGTLIETNMDDIEFSIAKKHYLANAKYMEV